MLAAPLAIGKNLETLAAQLQQYAGARAKSIQLAVTEWGPYFHVSPSSSWVDHNKTIASAVYTASVLKRFAEAKQLGAANAFKLTDNAAFMGWIGRRSGEWKPNAPMLAFQLYSRHFGEFVVQSAVNSPTYDSQKIGLIDSVSGVPYVEVVASRSRDGRTLRWIAINKHLDQPIETTFRFDGRSPSGKWRVRTLSGTAIDAHTGTELPSVPGLNWAKQETALGKSSFYSTSDKEVTLVESVWDPAPSNGVYKLAPCSVTSFEAVLR
jgi:alpha-N-arabinofuranosidase